MDLGTTNFTSEVVTQKSSSWSGHGPTTAGTFVLPGDGEEDGRNDRELQEAATGQRYTVVKALAYVRYVLRLLDTK